MQMDKVITAEAWLQASRSRFEFQSTKAIVRTTQKVSTPDVEVLFPVAVVKLPQ